jgi:hypothetical protein
MKKLDSNLIAEMKKTALENPHNPGCNPIAPMVCLQEDVDYKGINMNVMLTFEYFTPESDQQVWHLSMSRTDHKQLDPDIEQEIIRLAFKERGNITQIPKESFPPELRFMGQYIQVLRRKFDVEKKQWRGEANPNGTEKK